MPRDGSSIYLQKSPLTVVHGNGRIRLGSGTSKATFYIQRTGKMVTALKTNGWRLLAQGRAEFKLFPKFNEVWIVSAYLIAEAAHLISFNRSPTWITPEFGENLAPSGKGREAFYPEEEKDRMREDPQYLLAYRKMLEDAMNGSFTLFKRDSPEQRGAME